MCPCVRRYPIFLARFLKAGSKVRIRFRLDILYDFALTPVRRQSGSALQHERPPLPRGHGGNVWWDGESIWLLWGPLLLLCSNEKR